MIGFAEYVDGVLDGSIITGAYVLEACQRHNKDLLNPLLEFRPEEAQKAFAFISFLQHSTDADAGNQFLLEPWQEFLVGSIFGWFWKDTKKRRFSESYIQVARKNGKSSLAIAMALYHFVTESETNAEVLIAANSAKQAKDVLFKITKDFVNKLDPQHDFIISYYNELKFRGTGSSFKVMASDVKTLAGYNTSFGIIDEYYSAMNNELRELFRTSMVARENAHLMTITTAGWSTDGPCYMLRESCINVLDGAAEDESLFTLIYELDEKDEWTDPKNFIKANPNLGITVRTDVLIDSVKKATQNPSRETNIKTLHLDMWCQSRTTWISDKYLSACFEELDINDFKNQECYVGVDLASTSDLCATVVMFIRDEEYYFFPIFYIPLETLNDRPDTHKYQNWHQRKLITITDGNTTNYDMITNDLIEVDNNHIIRQIAYDRYNAQKWALDCQNKGLPMREFSQSIGNFNSPTRHMEMIILSGKAHFHVNEILLHHFKNVMLKSDHNGNIKPTKSNGKAGGQARNKIDGVIAAIQALATGLYDNRTSGMIY